MICAVMIIMSQFHGYLYEHVDTRNLGNPFYHIGHTFKKYSSSTQMKCPPAKKFGKHEIFCENPYRKMFRPPKKNKKKIDRGTPCGKVNLSLGDTVTITTYFSKSYHF